MTTGQTDEPYHGNCHCGRFRFKLTVNDIKEAIVCPCSLCAKRGCLWIIPGPGTFAVTRDEGCLTEYVSTAMKSKFCNHCGICVTGEHLSGPLRGQPLVNIRAIQEVNPFKLSSFIRVSEPEDIKTPSRIPNDLTAATAAHTCSCHCGKVRAELMVPIAELEVKEDNCSSCVRDAYIGVYPTKDQVKIYGREDTIEYLYGRKFNGTSYCKTCGITVFSNVYGPPLTTFDKLPHERKERAMAVYWKNMALQPLNARTIDGLDIGSLEIKRVDEGTEGYVLPP